MIIRIDNTLSEAECALLRRVYEQNHHRTTNKDWFGCPLLYYRHLRDTEVNGLLKKTAARAIVEIKTRLDIHDQLLEMLLLTKIGQGAYHPPHADNCRLDGDKWVPNHTPQRTFTVMQYLNDDFEGGEICWPTRNVTMKPKTGMMLAFPADHEHLHEVFPVTNGFRYTVAMWMTANPGYELRLVD